MGHPLVTLTWLVNWLRSRGIRLKPGEIMGTGTGTGTGVCTGHRFAAPGDEVRTVFNAIGQVAVLYA